MNATVGRVVHYVEPVTREHRAAIVTGLLRARGGEGAVALRVFGIDDTWAVPDAVEEPTGTWPGTWHWPERDA